MAGSKRKGMPISMLDEKTAAVAGDMSDILRQSAIGTLFVENWWRERPAGTNGWV
jgi:hypothetical protein